MLSEFVGSLENLPSEIQHILAEIAGKEFNLQETRQKLMARESAVQKHAKANGLLTENPKEQQSNEKCRADYKKMAEYADEKIRLAERGEALIARHLAKLEKECEKLQKQGIPVGLQPLQSLRAAAESAPPSPGPTVPYTPAAPSADRGVKRKNAPSAINTAAAPSPLSTSTNAPYTAATSARPGRPSRLSTTFVAGSPAVSDADSYGARDRKRSYKKRRVEEDDYEDEDGEGEEEEEEDETAANESAAGNPTDDALYCLCQRVSFGEMVGCDNDACTYEWVRSCCQRH